MQTSTRMLSLINAQLTILADKGKQTERLSAELKRIADSKPPYYIAVGVKTAQKLIQLAEKAGMDICDLLQHARENTEANEQHEQSTAMGEVELKMRRELHRQELARIIAAGHLQNIYMAVINRATESLCQAQMYIIGADSANAPAGWLPTTDHLETSLKELRNLTMSYAHDLAEMGEMLEQYDTPQKFDAFEVKTPKEALQIIQAFTSKWMETAISLSDSACNSVCSLENMADWERKERIEWLSAYGVAASSMSQYAANVLNEAMKAIGTVTITNRVIGGRTIVPEDMHAAISALTSKQANWKLN
ncbi:MAG: hypothetical protein JSS83_28385 [Cyanobacteria bacterium SZAS LIN-3]|nr:hypothetical protein [Cyanobacteria bacterium SZAS LIN-3]